MYWNRLGSILLVLLPSPCRGEASLVEEEVRLVCSMDKLGKALGFSGEWAAISGLLLSILPFIYYAPGMAQEHSSDMILVWPLLIVGRWMLLIVGRWMFYWAK